MPDYTAPKPIDPIWFTRGRFINVSCQCGRNVSFPLAEVVRRHRLHRDTPLYRVLGRLVCRQCGQRPDQADVTVRARWA